MKRIMVMSAVSAPGSTPPKVIEPPEVKAAAATVYLTELRMQSLSNTRNEAFDLMTNFIKKMQDNRSSILGNMR